MIINKSGGMASRAKFFHLSFPPIRGVLRIENIDIPSDTISGFFLLCDEYIFPTQRNDVGAFYMGDRDTTYNVIRAYDQNPGERLSIWSDNDDSFEYDKETKTLTLSDFFQVWDSESMTLVVWW